MFRIPNTSIITISTESSNTYGMPFPRFPYANFICIPLNSNFHYISIFMILCKSPISTYNVRYFNFIVYTYNIIYILRIGLYRKKLVL